MGLRIMGKSSFFKNTVYEKWQKKSANEPFIYGQNTYVFELCFKFLDI